MIWAPNSGARTTSAITRRFDFDKILERVENQGLLPRELRSKKRDLAAAFRSSGGSGMADGGSGIVWKRHEIRSVRLLYADQAVVYMRAWNYLGSVVKYRWLLHQRGGRWKIYELDMLDVGLSFSAILGTGLMMASEGDSDAGRRIQQFLQGLQLVGEGWVDAAEETLASIPMGSLPESFEAVRLTVLAAYRIDQKRFEEAHSLLDTAKSLGELPLLPLLRAWLHLRRAEIQTLFADWSVSLVGWTRAMVS